jgi:excisionase family DNA binding protein
MNTVTIVALLTTAEMCAALRCNRRTLNRLVANAKLTPIRPNSRRTLYSQADLERYIAAITNDDATIISQALQRIAEQQAAESRLLCPGCGKRRVNRGASLCTWCEQTHETVLLHKRTWWDQHGNDWRNERKAQTNG